MNTRSTKLIGLMVALLSIPMLFTAQGIQARERNTDPIIRSSDPAPSAASAATYFDLAIDETRKLIYASDRSGGKIDIISLTTLQVTSSVAVGSEPTGLDISPDNLELAVALFGQAEIAFIDLSTLTVTTRVTPLVTVGPNKPFDLLYGRPGRLYSVGNPDSSGFDYVHVFNTNTHTEVGTSTEIMRAAPRLAITADHNTLYVSQVTFSPNKIYRFDISTDTPVQTAEAPHGPVEVNTLAVKPDGSKVYSSRGQVWSGDLTTNLGSFSPLGEEIEYSDSLNRFYISESTYVVEYDAENYASLRTVNLGSTTGVARINSTGTILYVSTSAGIKAVPLQSAYAYLPCITRAYCSFAFSDNFNSPNTHWPIYEDSDMLFNFVNGEYQIVAKNPDWWVAASPDYLAENFDVGVQVRNPYGRDGTYGIVFNLAEDWSHFYTFEIDTFGYFGIWRYNDTNGWKLLLVNTSPFINQGTTNNNLRVRRAGKTIEVYANGHLLASISDGTYVGRHYLGLIVSSYDQANMEARFDNFYVTPSECGSTQTLSGSIPERLNAIRGSLMFQEVDKRLH